MYDYDQAHSQKCGVGEGFECRTHSNGGAEGTDEVGSGEGVSPLPVGVGSAEGAVPPSRNFFCIFSFTMVHFDAL